MRLRPFLLLAALCSLPVCTPAWASDPLGRSDPASVPRARMTAEQRFAAVNLSHDGKLTLDQARIGYKTVARNFDAIDTSGKGFVTLDDIRTWRRMEREARRAERAERDDPLRPRPAIQHLPADQSRAGAQGKPTRDTTPTPSPETAMAETR